MVNLNEISKSRLLTPLYFGGYFLKHGGVKALLGGAFTGGVISLIEQTISQASQTDAVIGSGSSEFAAIIMGAWALGLGIYTITKASEGINGAISDVRNRAAIRRKRFITKS